MTRGTPAAGLKHTHSHALSRYTGRSNFHLQKRKDAQSGGGFHAKKRRYNWSTKALRRNTTGTGRMRHLRHINRREKNGWRSGSQAVKKVKAWTSWETLSFASDNGLPSKNCLKVIINKTSLHFYTEVSKQPSFVQSQLASCWSLDQTSINLVFFFD